MTWPWKISSNKAKLVLRAKSGVFGLKWTRFVYKVHFFGKRRSHGVEGGGAGGSPPLFGQNLWTKFSPFHQCLFDFMLCSTFPVSHCSVARTEMFPAAYANTFCFQRKLFVSFPTFCREKNVEIMLKWCCRSGTASRGTRCWRPTSPAPYSSLSASTSSRWSLFQSEFGNKNELVCSPNHTWSIPPQKSLVNIILFRPNYLSITSRWSLFQSEFSNKN